MNCYFLLPSLIELRSNFKSIRTETEQNIVHSATACCQYQCSNNRIGLFVEYASSQFLWNFASSPFSFLLYRDHYRSLPSTIFTWSGWALVPFGARPVFMTVYDRRNDNILTITHYKMSRYRDRQTQHVQWTFRYGNSEESVANPKTLKHLTKLVSGSAMQC